MYLVIIQLFKNEYKEDLFMALSSAGIQQTTYCDSFNLDNELRNTSLLFSGLFKSPEEKEFYATTYFCIAGSREQIAAIPEGFEIAGIDWKKEEIFRMTIIKAEDVIQPGCGLPFAAPAPFLFACAAVLQHKFVLLPACV